MVVTATNLGGSASAASDETATITAPVQAPVNTAAPDDLRHRPSRARRSPRPPAAGRTPPTSYTYQWQDCASTCTDISGATAATYTLSAADVGNAIDVVVTASNSAGSATATSDPTATVTASLQAPVNTAVPAISGTAQQGRTLSATTGTWSHSPSSYGYQWQDCASSCTNIAGATASTYTLGASDVGEKVDVVVTAGNSAGSASATSAPTTAVTTSAQTPVNTAVPAISGSAQQGHTLSATTGSWSNSPTAYAYQWQDCASSCTNISGATASTYTLGGSDVGSTVDVVLTASNAAGSANATSAKTGTVSAVSSASGIHVSGNQLLDGSGQVVRLRGVVRSGTEYMCSEGYGMFDGPTGSSEFQPMLSWGIDTVFIGLNEDCWLGINGINPAYSGTNYINAIKSEVSAAESAGIYPVIGWFWGDPGAEVPTGNDPNGGGQPALPDNDHAPLFWQQVAQTFKGDPNVIFRLQEEPHPSASGPNGAGASTGGGFGTNLAQWQCWANGSVQYGTSSDSSSWSTAPAPTATTNNCEEYATNGSTLYRTVGMQSLIDVIRGAGADNVIQVPGHRLREHARLQPQPVADQLRVSRQHRRRRPARSAEHSPAHG